MNWWVHAQGLSNYGIQERKGFKFVTGWRAKGTIGVREMFDLFLIEFLAEQASLELNKGMEQQ